MSQASFDHDPHEDRVRFGEPGGSPDGGGASGGSG